MRDKKDLKTLEIPCLPKKRGRPSTGAALTPAQRKAAQRDRERLAINTARTASDYADLSTAALIKALTQSVEEGIPKLTKIISDILVARAKQNFDSVE